MLRFGSRRDDQRPTPPFKPPQSTPIHQPRPHVQPPVSSCRPAVTPVALTYKLRTAVSYPNGIRLLRDRGWWLGGRRGRVALADQFDSLADPTPRDTTDMTIPEFELRADDSSVLKPVFDAASYHLATARIELGSGGLRIWGNDMANVRGFDLQMDADRSTPTRSKRPAPSTLTSTTGGTPTRAAASPIRPRSTPSNGSPKPVRRGRNRHQIKARP